jgi:hypothetical protein
MTAVQHDNYLRLPKTQNSESFLPHLCLFIVNNYYIIYNIRKVLKCGAGEEWRRLAGPIV